MRMIALLSMMSLALAPTFAAPVVSHEGDMWSLENDTLKVEVNAATGRFQVLDKASGYLWKGADEGAEAPTLLAIPSTEELPKADGDLADWGGRGVSIDITPDMLADARKVDGPSDLSGKLRLLWNRNGLCLGLEVRDEKLVFASADEEQWWFKDSVEFWIDETQYAVRFGPWGTNVWSGAGNVAEAKAAFKESEAGYGLEVMMPAGVVGDAVKKGVGGQFRFALGINDCDGDDGRQGQLYYPTSWVHSNPSTFAHAVLADADGKAPITQLAPKAALEAIPAGDEAGPALAFKATAKSGAREFPVTITFRLDGDRPDLLISVDTEDHDMSVGRFGVLHPLVLDRPNGRILGAQYCNGVGVPTDDMSWRGRQWTTYGTLDMPWVGLTDGEIGYMLLWDLPVSCDNGAALFEKVRAGDKDLLAPGVYHYPIKGKFGQERIVRYSFMQRGGHVAICKRYRDYAKQHGFLVTQKEKMEKKPELAKLPGAPDIWGRSDLTFCREAKAAGMDRLLVNGPQPWDDMEEIKKLGYLMSVYDNYEDAHEGDAGRYGDFVEATDTVIRADGSLMKAWLTRSEPPKQFMKRCAALHEKVARTWVPKELEKHPYNARFIDVTTACSLRECYSETHGLTRTEDREVKRGLARYIGDELNLVLGGEHGRWWGADIFNYWEGMQSGGFYSWPAGYVGRDLPESREKIGKRYLEWGLGEKNRYPLWELVFHDCVVSTWYWGDSTGHLQEVAPDLGYKKDAFNILYGTVPLYWANKVYSYDWNKEETRERMLESYRNTCKLHEQIAFEEMVSHEFVTEDRAVQKTVFGDGTEVWVNFGEEPWTLKREGKEYVLPQYGFYAKGPKIEQYRIVKNGGGVATLIRAADYLFVQGDAPGLVEASGGAPQTMRFEGPATVRLISSPGTEWVRINWRALCPDGGEGVWRIMELDEEGKPQSIQRTAEVEGDILKIAAADLPRSIVLVGPKALANGAELVLAEWPTPEPENPKQGTPVAFTVKVTNVGGKDADGVSVAMIMDRGNEDTKIATKTVDVPSGATVAVSFPLDTKKRDGELFFWFKADSDNAIEEMCEADNLVISKVSVEPDWSLWDSHLDVTVRAGEAAARAPIVKMPFDADGERAKLGKAGKADPAAIRVVKLGPNEGEHKRCRHQMTEGDGASELVWRLPGVLEPGGSARCRIYMDGLEAARHEAGGAGNWVEQDRTYFGPWYFVEFKEGYIRGITLAHPRTALLSHLGVSSQDTGWVDEVGEVESFEVLQDGPVFTQIRVKKKLSGNHHYDKLYTFYMDHFLVTTLSEERFGNLSRAYYVAKCQYEDDRGNKAQIDGKGDAENISGKNPKPKWYATWTDEWALCCVAVTPHDNVTYWDSGSWAGLGFSTGRKEPATVAYFIHRMSEDAKATDLAALDYERAHNPVTVSR